MLVLIALLLALVPAAAILYPFLRSRRASEALEDESSNQAELAQRWDAALSGLKNTELEWALGSLAEEDYRRLRREYMTEAALVVRTMELQEEQERELLYVIEAEVQQVRLRTLGRDGANPPTECPHTSSTGEHVQRLCAQCGRPLSPPGTKAGPSPSPHQPARE